MIWIPAPAWLILGGVLLELALRYPPCLPHPVRLIGRLLDALELSARRSPRPRLAGGICLLLCLALTGGLVALAVSLPWLGPVLALFLAASGLALGELGRACREALDHIERGEAGGDLAEARLAVGQLVSRDTEVMTAAELRRSLAESLSENFNDAFTAPVFWLLIGGPVGLWLYKAASTMDSMWGYRTPAWKDLGLAGARLDDGLAWLPARLSAMALWLAASGPERTNWPGWAAIRRQAARMDSPNAGWPMAAAAWLHNAPMGGPTPYYGNVVDKPILGPEPSTFQGPGHWTSARLEALLRHVSRAGLLLAVCCAFAALLLAHRQG